MSQSSPNLGPSQHSTYAMKTTTWFIIAAAILTIFAAIAGHTVATVIAASLTGAATLVSLVARLLYR